MKIYLMRHGVAVERQESGNPAGAETAAADDAARPLTLEGVERTRLAAHGLVTMGVSIDCILSSPYVRSVQTAAIAGEALGVPRLAIETTEALLPEADPEALLPILRALEVETALCIGHAPQLDALIARLLGTPRVVTSLKKAGVAVLEAKLHSDTARIIAIYEPKTLRQLGRIR